MNRAFRLVTLSFLLLTLLLLSLLGYLFYGAKAQEKKSEQKRALVAFVGLSDLALSNERYLRHRSLSTPFQVYSVDGALREYDTESFVQRKGYW